MRKRSSLILAATVTLMISMLVPACSKTEKKTETKPTDPPDLLVTVNPNDIDTAGEKHFSATNGKWLSNLFFDTTYRGYNVNPGGYFEFYGDVDPSVYETLDLQNTASLDLTMYIFEKNDDYAWNIEDAVFTTTDMFLPDGYISNHQIRGMVEVPSCVFQVRLPGTIGCGMYTIVIVRKDKTIDCVFNFAVDEEKDLEINNETIAKPVIYLYPEQVTDITVRLDLRGQLTCSYPEYRNGWEVTVSPDGKIYDKGTGRNYDYLFWEAEQDLEGDLFSRSACVAREDTVAFLEEYLTACGLNDRETDDFISYWLPKLQSSPYNLIAFPTELYKDWAKLEVVPVPDREIRVYMIFTPLDAPVEIPEERKLQIPEQVSREGYTVVEWGGTALDGET